jgi:FkbM family methyltransferase
MPSTASVTFLEDVLRQFLMRFQQRQKDNYDAMRFSYDGVDRSSVFDLENHMKSLYFFIFHYEKLHAASLLFEDDASRALFVELILWRLAGHLYVKLSTNNQRYWELLEEASAVPSEPSRFNYKSIFGPLRHFEEVEFCNRKLTVDMWPANLASTFLIKQYFFERENVQICPRRRDHVVDAGSCLGDTALAFAMAVGAEGRVYTFDPLGSHAEIVRHNIAQNQLQDRIRFFPVGLGAHPNEVPGPVKKEDIVDPGFNLDRIGGADLGPIRTIDGLVAGGDIPRVDFLKMDIEGYELAALQGAEKTLCRFKPRLAISIYHSFFDFFKIPLFVHSLDLGYRFYLDHYSIHSEETVLYAAAS